MVARRGVCAAGRAFFSFSFSLAAAVSATQKGGTPGSPQQDDCRARSSCTIGVKAVIQGVSILNRVSGLAHHATRRLTRILLGFDRYARLDCCRVAQRQKTGNRGKMRRGRGTVGSQPVGTCSPSTTPQGFEMARSRTAADAMP
jgi:hypothetical protein